MSDCHYQKQLAEYVVGGLGSRARKRLAAHLQACAPCRAEVAALQRTGSLLQAAGIEAAPDDWERVRRRIEREQVATARPRLRWAWGLAAGAIAVVLLSWGGLVLRPHRTVVPPTASPIAQTDEEVRATMEAHLSAAWAAPLTDDAAVGLGLAEVDGEQ